jgi:hypothetical protein
LSTDRQNRLLLLLGSDQHRCRAVSGNFRKRRNAGGVHWISSGSRKSRAIDDDHSSICFNQTGDV